MAVKYKVACGISFVFQLFKTAELSNVIFVMRSQVDNEHLSRLTSVKSWTFFIFKNKHFEVSRLKRMAQ